MILEVGSRPRSAASLEFRVSTAAHTQVLCVRAVLPGTPAGADTRAGFLWLGQSEVRPPRSWQQLPLEFVRVMIARVARRRAALLVCLGSGHRRVPWFFSGSASLRWGGSAQTDSETIDNRSVLWWRIPTGALMVPSGLSSLMLRR